MSIDLMRLAQAIRDQIDSFSDQRLNDGDDVEREVEYRCGVAKTANAMCVALRMDATAFAAACGLYVSDGRDSYSDCRPGELTWEKPRVSDTPIQRGFEYEVRMAVSIPLAWATLLKQSAEHHYDYKCREAGKSGVVKGLFNTARGGEFPSTYAVSWSNLDLITKVAEQLHHHTKDQALILAIRGWLRTTMDAIKRQHVACRALSGSKEEVKT
jgi:hypothetical protein